MMDPTPQIGDIERRWRLSSNAHFPLVGNLGDEVLALEDDLRSLAGSDSDLGIECHSCYGIIGLDFNSLLRLLMALMDNSVEEMLLYGRKAKRHRIRISVGWSNGAGSIASPSPSGLKREKVMLVFRDNGPGISSSDLPTVFDQNPGGTIQIQESSLDSSSFQESQDAVLDAALPRYARLSIVRDLVESGSGRVRVVSRYGLGTRFNIEVPILK
jgi:signal transduction histidine kinase